MPLNIRDVESAYLEGRARVEQWKVDFLAEWMKPELETQVIQFWTGMPPAMREFMRANHPEAAAQVDKLVQGLKERQSNGTIK